MGVMAYPQSPLRQLVDCWPPLGLLHGRHLALEQDALGGDDMMVLDALGGGVNGVRQRFFGRAAGSLRHEDLAELGYIRLTTKVAAVPL